MIYLLRHGETEFNREGRVQGQRESRLTALGERQAAAMADLLHGLTDGGEGWTIIASPLIRAAATARIVGERLGLPVSYEPRLMEVFVGGWEGELRADLARTNPGSFAGDAWYFDGPGGETYDDVLARVTAWMAEHPETDSRRLIVVSHGVAGRLMRGAYAGLSRAQTQAQDVPQDAIYRLSGGNLERIACAVVD